MTGAILSQTKSVKTKVPGRWCGLALMFWAGMAWGSCTVSVNAVDFGIYDVFASTDSDSTGNIEVTCDVSTNYTLSLSAGNGTYSERLMASGTHTLIYNLYTDATRSVIWGDGSSSTSVVDGSSAGTAQNHTVYGRIPARQNIHVNTYTDAVVVTVEF